MLMQRCAEPFHAPVGKKRHLKTVRKVPSITGTFRCARPLKEQHMIFNLSDNTLEAMQAQAKKLTEEANSWLASVDSEELKKACDRGECVFHFDNFPEASEASKRVIVANLISRMNGQSAELSFDFGMAGSIWFDAEVPDSDKSPTSVRPVRVAFVPPGNPEYDSVSPKPRHVFGVLCLKQMYS